MKVRSDVMKLSKSMHTWVGITSGILLFICFFAGGLSMFQYQFSKWATPQQLVLNKIQPDQYQQLIDKVQQQFPETQQSFSLSFQDNEFYYAPLSWKEKRGRGFNRDQTSWLASLDENGELVTRQENLSKAGWLIEQLHETAGIPGIIGHEGLGVYVMGVVSVLYFLAIMSGLFILLPTLVKDYFAIRPGKNKKRFWLDTHNVVGITSLPFHIIISITVIVFAFHDLFYDSINHLALNNASKSRPPVAERMIDTTPPQLNIAKILHKVKEVSPEYTIDYIEFSDLENPEKANARIALYSGEQMLRGASNDFMRMNPYEVDRYNHSGIHTQAGAGETAINAMFSLHFGSYGGNPVRWIYLILGLGGAFLFYSGNILWIETRARKQKRPQDPIPTQRKDVVFMANLTIGTCLGCIIGIIGALVIGRWVLALWSVQSANHLFMNSYYGLFFLSIIYTFITGYAKALPQLLLSISTLLFAMPITSAIAVIFPDLGLGSYHAYLSTLDIVALLFALAFLRFYQQAKDRKQAATAGSLWAVK